MLQTILSIILSVSTSLSSPMGGGQEGAFPMRGGQEGASSLSLPTGEGRGGASSLLINEVMQSNIDYLMVDNDFPDSWVELYNPTAASISLAGWRIGVKDDVSMCYTLPSAVVPAGGHIVICCDKENNGLHTDFRVDSGKGGVYLFNAQGEKADAVTLKKMPAPNVAYGRTSDGADEWHYEFTPTAGSANTGGGAQTVLPQPVFSYPGGAFILSGGNPVPLTGDSQGLPWLTITMPDGVPDDAMIVYTMDGTEPVLGRAGGKRVSLPITKTYCIRAKIVSQTGNGIPSPSVTNTYIFHPRAVTMPIVSLATDNRYMNDTQIGILSAAVNDGVPNYMQKWRRPLNVEYIDINGVQRINQLAETAVSGVSTRENLQKSLKLYANKRFGTKNFSLSTGTSTDLSSGEGLLWKDKPNVTAVKSMVLRSGGNNSASSKINDALVQTIFGTHIDNLDWQAYQPVIVYLNGQYLGEYALRERSDEDYIEANYDGLEDVELADETSYQTPEAGTLFAEFYNLYHDSRATYADITAAMDEDNFLKTLCVEIYGMNTDYPTNNVSMWTTLPPVGETEGVCWRWILKDMDRFGMSLPLYPRSFDMIRYMFSPDDLMYGGLHHFDLYKRMGRFGDFSGKFVDMMAVYLGDFLKPAVVKAKMTDMRNEIEDEVKATFSKLHISMNDFTSGMNYLTRAIDERPGYLYDQMNAYFQLGGVYPVTVATEGHEVSINGIKLTEGNFDGKYFANRTLTLTAPEGDTWKMTVTKAGVPTTKTYPTSTIAVPLSSLGLTSGASVSFTLVPGTETGVASLPNPFPLRGKGMYNVLGQRVTAPQAPHVEGCTKMLIGGKVYIVR